MASPGRLTGPAGSRLPAPLVGRDRELADLLAGLADAEAGRGRLYLLSGEPGVGKTRLLEEVAARAGARGAIAAWGRCWEGDDAPPLWPWMQTLRALASHEESAAVAEANPMAAAQVTRLVPRGSGWIRAEVSAAQPTPAELRTPGDAGRERFQMLDGLAGFLTGVASRRPLVVLLDDLHASDSLSLLLLEFLARDLRHSSLLVVAAYREAEVRHGCPLSDRLAELARHSTAMPLRGLDAAATQALIAKLAGAEPPKQVVTTIHEATGGNPFFLDEVVRLLLVEGGLDTPALKSGHLRVPDRVRSVVRARLGLLTLASQATLHAAAAVGPSFDADLLAEVLDTSAEDTHGALATACLLGVIEHLEPRGFRFSHALIRETLYEDLAPTRRALLHARIATALETRYAGRHDAILPVLAHHFFQAQPHADAARAALYARRAGEQALALCAYESAADYFEQALALLDAGAAVEPSERGELLVALGHATVRVGDLVRAKGAVAAAAAQARRLTSPTMLAEAALILRVGVDAGIADPERIALLEEALAALGTEDSALRARVLAQLSWELYRSGGGRSDEMSREAVSVARRVSDSATLGHALAMRCFALWGAQNEEDRLPLAAELLELASRTGDRELAMEAYHWRVIDFFAQGDLTAADRDIAAATQLAERLHQHYYRWWCGHWHAMRAMLCGRFSEAERIAAETFAIGEPVQPANAKASFEGQLFALLWMRGDYAGLGPIVESIENTFQDVGNALEAPLLRIRTGMGQLDEARHDFERLLKADLMSQANARHGSWRGTLCFLAEVCAEVGDAASAVRLRDLLLPLAGRVVVIGIGQGSFGPVDRYLGLLATVCRDWDEAETRFASSLTISRRLASPPFVTMTRADHAAMLIARGRSEDRARAEEMLAEAIGTADPLGMIGVATRARALRARLRDASNDEAIDAPAAPGAATVVAPPPASSAAPLSSPAARDHEHRLEREGEYWTFHYADGVCRVRDRVGMSYLATLLERPHEEVAALLLSTVAAEAAPDDGALALQRGELRAAWTGDLGEVLDPRARAEYRSALAALEEEIEDATRANDIGRAEQARAEQAALEKVLGTALGLGGRTRRAGSSAERARVRVTRALHVAIDRIRAVDPRLGDHLARSIRTGTFCSYAPAQQAIWIVVREVRRSPRRPARVDPSGSSSRSHRAS